MSAFQRQAASIELEDGAWPAPSSGVNAPVILSPGDLLQNASTAESSSGRPARQMLLACLNEAIRRSVATGVPAALLLLDLNNFSEVNAAYGQPAGDDVLATTALRVQRFAAERLGGNASGSVAIAGRLDADHFAIIVPDVPNFETLKSAAVELHQETAQPLTLSGRELSVLARSVIVQIPDHGRSVTSVLGRAFKILNTVARTSADRVVLAEAETIQDDGLPMLDRDLAAALSSDEIFIVLQPKFDINSGLLAGAEALVRWHHPQHGHLPPPVFIEAAEESGLIFDLGFRILRDACSALKRLAPFVAEFNLAVNVSARQLDHPDFLARFLEVVDREGVAPQSLEIELTESAAMTGGKSLAQSLQAIRHCGIGVAIDDFGTGFSNLASLSTFPADTLKIDRSLVAFRNEDVRAAGLLAIAVQLAHTFDMKTVAEGVETESQLECVRRLGCDYVQGYLTGRPVSTERFADTYLTKSSTAASLPGIARRRKQLSL